MKSLNTIKLCFLLALTLSLTNCKDKVCQEDLKACQEKLEKIEAALDEEADFPMTMDAFDFCSSDEAISSGSYNTLTGIAHAVIPVPKDSRLISSVKKGNTITYNFKGMVYSNDTRDYKATITGLSRVPKSKLTIILNFEFKDDKCPASLPKNGKRKESEVQGAP